MSADQDPVVLAAYAELRRQADDAFGPWTSDLSDGTVQIDGDVDLQSLIAVVQSATRATANAHAVNTFVSTVSGTRSTVSESRTPFRDAIAGQVNPPASVPILWGTSEGAAGHVHRYWGLPGAPVAECSCGASVLVVHS